MSVDYPSYQELRKKSKCLGGLWLIGDIGYYLGLVGVVIWPLAIINYQLTKQKVHLPWEKALLMAFCGMTFCWMLSWGAGNLQAFVLKKGKML